MPVILTLFLGSLIGITIMIGRKISSLKEIQDKDMEEPLLDIPDLEEIKIIVLKKIRGYGYNTLVITLRFYILSSHFLKKKSKELYAKAKNKLNRTRPGANPLEKREVSKFLKMVSEYKDKIRNIKHRIKEEENIE